MTPRARPTPAAQEGFVLIEILVSALILAVVAGAVLTLLTATTRSSDFQRTQAKAYALAQEDQARLRSLRLSSLNRLEQEQPPIQLDGTTFNVRSQGTFISNSTGSVSCDGDASPADYVRITTTVSSPAMRNDVVMQSVVAPSTGSLDPSHGTISVKATNAAGLPLSGVLVEGSGTSNFNGSTDSTGCANFADLPSGNYDVTTSAGGMIDMNGETSTEKEIGVPFGGIQTVSLVYDQGGWIEPEFVYRVGSTGTFAKAPVDSYLVYNGESGASAKLIGVPGGARKTGFISPEVFPFKNKDTVYAGSCTSNNPDPEEKLPANRAAMGFPLVPPNGTVKPLIQLPALNLTVTYGTPAISGARVTITDTICKYNGSFVKRVYTTNASGRPSANVADLVPELGLPWGKYKVCASARVKENEWRKVESSTTSVENLTTGTTLALNLSGSGSSGSSSSSIACP
jgi:Tfp pilus assembly protein PilV